MPRLASHLVAAAIEQAGDVPSESFQHRKEFESARARAALVRHLLHATSDGGYLLIAVGGVHSRHCEDLQTVSEILNRMGAPA